MNIVVVGGTGLIGSKVVRDLRDHGHHATPASPDSGVNSATGEGLPAALEGAAVVVDVTNAPSFEHALRFFEASTRNLLNAEATVGVGHHVVLSVVGTEHLSASDYFRGKRAQESLVAHGEIPYTIVRATQFFEFIEGIADAATYDGTVRLPPVFVQPAAADDVASTLGRIATGSPNHGMVQVAGPQRFRLDELVRRTLGERGDPREVITDPDARYFGAEIGERTLVPDDDAVLTETTFERWRRQAVMDVR